MPDDPNTDVEQEAQPVEAEAEAPDADEAEDAIEEVGEEHPMHPRHGVNDIVAAARAARAADMAEDGQEEEPPAEEPAAEADAPEQPPVEDAPEEQMVEVTVNGQKMMRPLSQVVEDAQKVQSATQMFEEAARLRAEAREATAPPAAPEDEAAAPPEDSPEGEGSQVDVSDLVQKLRYGSDEEAEDAAKKLFPQGTAGPSQPAGTPDPNAMVEAVTQQVFARQAVDEAGKTFTAEYPEVANDPDLMLIAGRKALHHRYQDLTSAGIPLEHLNSLNEIQLTQLHMGEQQRGRVRSEKDLYVAVGKETMDWIGATRGAATPADQPARQEAQERKTGTPQPPAPASQRASVGPAETEQRSSSSVVQDMMRQRGQTG